VNIFGEVVKYHYDDKFFVSFLEAHYKIHGNVSPNNGWD
jgi:hypothetical protein